MKGSYIPDISLVRTERAREVGGFTKSGKDLGYLNHFAFYHRLLKLGNADVKMLRGDRIPLQATAEDPDTLHATRTRRIFESIGRR